MNVRCPACSRLYRIADDRVQAGAILRCTGCGHQFAGAGRPKDPIAMDVVQPADRRRPGAAAPRQVAPPPTPDRFAILADAGRPFRSTIKPVLQEFGFRIEAVEQGTEAFRLAVARHPSLIVASVHLAGLSGVAICEGVKQSPHLKDISVVLVGSQDTADLFNHDTALAYGADLFLDEAMRADDMTDRLSGLFGPIGLPQPAGGDDEDMIPALDGLTGGAASTGAPREEIRRLARIMLADLRLYNPDRFREALDEGRLLEVFKVELARGRDIVDQRFPDLDGRQDQLATALRDSIEQERLAGARS
ncbi:MAG TPA: zinc-ribbon domain-containing protein [Dongiaceae bacterium]|nr:zinc-ribbon domain-containing protein [Dongiaceae bacterium]